MQTVKNGLGPINRHVGLLPVENCRQLYAAPSFGQILLVNRLHFVQIFARFRESQPSLGAAAVSNEASIARQGATSSTDFRFLRFGRRPPSPVCNRGGIGEARGGRNAREGDEPICPRGPAGNRRGAARSRPRSRGAPCGLLRQDWLLSLNRWSVSGFLGFRGD